MWAIWVLAAIVIIVAAEAVFILPDKMPWNRRKDK